MAARPHIKAPKNLERLVALVAHINDYNMNLTRKSRSSTLFLYCKTTNSHVFCVLAVVTAAHKRLDTELQNHGHCQGIWPLFLLVCSLTNFQTTLSRAGSLARHPWPVIRNLHHYFEGNREEVTRHIFFFLLVVPLLLLYCILQQISESYFLDRSRYL